MKEIIIILGINIILFIDQLFFNYFNFLINTKFIIK
jgi:hypothetical protein